MKKLAWFFLIVLPLSAATLVTWNQVKTGVPKTGTFVLTGINGVLSWASPQAINFSDAEIPSGTINGTNPTFTLAHSPLGTSLILTFNGVIQQNGMGNDYLLSGSTITFVSNIPQTGDIVQAWYRY